MLNVKIAVFKLAWNFAVWFVAFVDLASRHHTELKKALPVIAFCVFEAQALLFEAEAMLFECLKINYSKIRY